jgi:hypothetical protein
MRSRIQRELPSGEERNAIGMQADGTVGKAAHEANTEDEHTKRTHEAKHTKRTREEKQAKHKAEQNETKQSVIHVAIVSHFRSAFPQRLRRICEVIAKHSRSDCKVFTRNCKAIHVAIAKYFHSDNEAYAQRSRINCVAIVQR